MPAVPPRAIALLSPGEMGQAVGAMLAGHGLCVLTCLEGRSERTRALAKTAGIGDVPSLADLVAETDMVLSVVPPTQALSVAHEVAAALAQADRRTVYVDCNAIAPSSVRAVADVVTTNGGGFVDVGIIGSPPREAGTTRFYASGPDVERFAELGRFGLDVRTLSRTIGEASALKMTYAALTKGTTAIATELLIAARRLGVYETLLAELRASQAAQFAAAARSVPRVPSVAHRWTGEMEEIAKTFAGLGLTPRIFEGVAALYRDIASTELGEERPETRDLSRGLDDSVEALTRAIAKGEPAAAE